MASSTEELSQVERMLDGFIREVNPATTKEEIFSQMEVLPIRADNAICGVIGLTRTEASSRKVVSFRLIYVTPEFRKGKLGPILEGLFRSFKEQGYTHAEGWTLPTIAGWLEKSLEIKPKLFVFNEELDSLLSAFKRYHERS